MSFQRELGEEAVKALEAVHGTKFDPINSADLCKLCFCNQKLFHC